MSSGEAATRADWVGDWARSSPRRLRLPDDHRRAPDPVGPRRRDERPTPPAVTGRGRRHRTPAAPLPVPGAEFRELRVDQIHANAKQPRQVFDEEALDELTHSIREFGVLQPVVVRPTRPAASSWSWGSAGCAPPPRSGWTSFRPSSARPTDDAMLRDALLENIHRAQLNPLEEAAAYQQLLEEFGTTHDELARRHRP